MIRVQTEDFDVGLELARLTEGRADVGGVASFVGLVRGEGVGAMTLEHYPGMTERRIEAIETEARRRWPLLDVVIIHRFGRLEAGERIVLVGVAAAHREPAFLACEFLMDWLKTRAPFWKLEERAEGGSWVGARSSDEDRSQRWEEA